MSRHRGRPNPRKVKLKVPPLPICHECPWRIWCPELNFRTMNPKREPIKVCPIWWMLTQYLREKGIMKAPPLAAIPISKEEGRAILDAARRQRSQRLAG